MSNHWKSSKLELLTHTVSSSNNSKWKMQQYSSTSSMKPKKSVIKYEL